MRGEGVSPGPRSQASMTQESHEQVYGEAEVEGAPGWKGWEGLSLFPAGPRPAGGGLPQQIETIRGAGPVLHSML